MITAIMLEGFRCFSETTRVTLGRLTVIAGANSAGKSSLIHAFLSLMQSEQQPADAHLRLSGEWVDLGSFSEVLSYARDGDERKFKIGLTYDADELEADLVLTLGESAVSSDGLARIERVEVCVNDEELIFEPAGSEFRALKRGAASAPWETLGGIYRYPWAWSPDHEGRILPYGPTSVLYLSAFRDSPRRLYQRRRSKLGPLLGTMGDYVAELLFERRNEETDILPEPGPPLLLSAALEAWWAHLFDGEYSIRAEAAEDLGFTISLDTPSAENLRLNQVGTGLSQVLPVLALGLCSKPNDLIIVESPEVQLHPAAQHRLMDFFVALTNARRQVILETHSDHIIHAVQLAVKQERTVAEDVAMRFLYQEAGVAHVDEVSVDGQGRLMKKPIGFLDQASADLLELLK